MPALSRPDGTLIHYEVVGSGFPVLCLSPGIGNSGIDSWRTSSLDPVAILGDEFRVILVDQRNAGESTGGLEPFSYDQAVADQLAILDDLGETAFHIVAESIGAAFAWRLAAEVPDRVAAIVAARPMGVVAGSNSLRDFLGLFADTMRVARARGMDAVVAAAEGAAGFEDRLEAGPFCQRVGRDPDFRAQLLGMPAEKYIAMLVRYRDALFPASGAFFSASVESLAQLAAPLMVLPGSDQLHPRDLANLLVQIMPRAVRLSDDWPVATDGRSARAWISQFLVQHNPTLV